MNLIIFLKFKKTCTTNSIDTQWTFKVMKIFNSKIATVARELKLIEENSQIILGCSIIDNQELKNVSAKITELLKLSCSLLSRKFSNNQQQMAKTLGFSNEHADIISSFSGSLDPDVFARADLFKSQGQWRLLEINVGSMLGGIFLASLPRLAGLEQKGDVLKQWAQVFSAKWPCVNQIAFVADSKHIPEMREPLKVLMSEISKYSQCKVIAIGHREVQSDNSRLFSPDGKAIDIIYRYFDEHTISASPDEYLPIIQSIASQKTLCPMGPTYALVSNKGLLAYLWQLKNKNELTSAESLLVEELIPWTEWLNPENISTALLNKNDLVLKPVNGLQGMNVVCGREVAEEKWATLIHKAAHSVQNQRYILQTYCDAESSSLILEKNGSIIQDQGRVLCGAFVFGSRPLGAFLRSKSLSESAVINISNGAAVGPWAG